MLIVIRDRFNRLILTKQNPSGAKKKVPQMPLLLFLLFKKKQLNAIFHNPLFKGVRNFSQFVNLGRDATSFLTCRTLTGIQKVVLSMIV